MPEVNVQFTVVPETDPLAYLQELIDGPRASGQLAEAWFLLVVQPKCAAISPDCGGPRWSTARYTHPNCPSPRWIKTGVEVGRLLTRYLTDRGHRHIAVLMMGVTDFRATTISRPGSSMR